MIYIIKLSPEITIKSRWVRKMAALKLKKNILSHFEFNNIEAKINENWDFIKVETKNNIWINFFQNIPWIANIVEVERFSIKNISEENIFDFIFDNIKDFYLDKISWKTFVVRVKRVWNHNFSSVEIEKYLWWKFLQNVPNLKVNLKNPEFIINLDIKNEEVFVIKDKIEWLSGYPVSFQWKVLSLISWWFDSSVSSFLMMKRWCEVDYLFFNLWWNAHEVWVKQVSQYLWKNFSVWYKRAKFITVNFEELISELLTKVDHSLRWVLLKRAMLKVSSRIAEYAKYEAIVKWDSLWQVSSQTLKNLNVINKVSETLVLRPLIWLNKQEIVNITQKIWTYNFSCSMPEYCWIISDKPSIASIEKEVLEQEQKLWNEVLERAFLWRKIENIKDLFLEVNSCGKIEVVNSVNSEIIIDLREADKIKKNSLQKIIKIENEILEIPFFEINHKFPKLDQTKNYLFYCDKWVLSELHSLYLLNLWFLNIKIFRPK